MNKCGIQTYNIYNTSRDVMHINKSSGILHKPQNQKDIKRKIIVSTEEFMSVPNNRNLETRGKH